MASSPVSPQQTEGGGGGSGGYGKLGLLRSKSTRTTSGRKESGASTAPSAPPITPQSLPSEVLIARFQDIKHIAKALVQYFENIVESENECAKSLVKASTTLNRVIPLESSFQFIPEEAEQKGLQGICSSIREKTREMSNHHINFAKSIESVAIEPLKKIRLDIKAHIKSIESEVKKLEIEAEKERESSGQAIIELNKSISLAQTQSHVLTLSNDPFVTNRQAYRQMKKQLKAENDLYQATVLAQQRSKSFEEDIITQFQRVWSNFENWSFQSRSSISTEWKFIKDIFVDSLTPDQEWNHFANIPGTILDPKASPKDLSSISYPGQNDEVVTVLKKGLLKRKKRWTKMESEGLWILTKSGFFHEVPKGNDDDDPILSLYLPNVTLGPLFSSPTSKEHGFVLEGNKEATGGVERAMKSKMGLGAKEIEYVFLAQSHYEAEEWWNTISHHVRDVYQSREKLLQEQAAASGAATAAATGAQEGHEAEDGANTANEKQSTSASAVASAESSPSLQQKQQATVEPPKLPERKATANSNASSTKTEPGVLEKHPSQSQQVKPRSASTSSPYPAEKTVSFEKEKDSASPNKTSMDKALQINTGNIPKTTNTSSDEKKTSSPAQPVSGSRFAERFDME